MPPRLAERYDFSEICALVHSFFRKSPRIFELQKSMYYHEKGLEKGYPMMIFSKTSTETWYVNQKLSNKEDILYIVEKVLKSSIQE